MRPIALFICLFSIFFGGPAHAQELSFSLGDDGTLATRTVQLFILVTVLSLVPGIAIMVTCFPFIVTVLAILRQAIGLQQSPPNMLMVSLALFLTYFVMEPVFTASWDAGIEPLLAGSLTAIGQSGWLPRLTIAIGVGLVVLGLAMLRGFQPALSLPKLNKGGNDQSVVSMFVFGVSYAIASLSCTIGIFITIVANTTRSDGFGQRLGSFLSYAIGMGLLATVITLAVGFGKKGLVNNFRRLLPKINLFSAVVLVIVGVYVALYGIWSQQVFSDPTDITPWIDSVVLTAEGWQQSLTGWMTGRVNPFGLFGEPRARTTIMGWSFLLINVIVGVAGFLARRSGPADSAGDATGTDTDTSHAERVRR